MTRVAIVIPTYNDAELALEAVASVREPEPVELVVVDDGSSAPEALRALDELERQGVRVMRRPNGGLPAARNAGVAATTAPYVLPLDSDDLLEEGSATALADALDRTPAVGFAYGDYREFGAVNRINRVPRSLLPWSTTYVHLYTPTHMFRRTTLEELGGWPPIRREDWALMLACIERGIDGVHVDHVVYARRMHEGTMSDDNRRRHRSQYAELRRRYRPVFERRAELARIERPPLWKRVAYPLVFGRRLLVPRRVEQRLRRTTIWARLRPLRR